MRNNWSIPLPNYLEKFSNEQLYLKGCEDILKNHAAELKKLKRRTRYYYLAGKPVPLDFLLQLGEKNNVFKKMTQVCSRSNPGIKLPKKLTSRLAYLVGALRDGSITKGDGIYTVTVNQSGKYAVVWLHFLAQQFATLFGVKPQVESDRDDYRIRVNSKPIVLFFERVFEMPRDQAQWNTPFEIEQNPESWVWYVAGFFDAEGYCPSVETVSKINRFKLKITQTNRDSLLFIKNALEKNGIKSAGPYATKNKSTFDLFIYGFDNVKSFWKKIPVVRKKKELESLVNSL